MYLSVHVFFIRAATPIDLLAKYVNTTEDEVDIEIQEPYHLLRVGTCIVHLFVSMVCIP